MAARGHVGSRKVEAILAADPAGVTVWTDETCGELCVIEHNDGGGMRRHSNPGCDRHRLPATASASPDHQ